MFFSIALLIVIIFLAFKASPVEKKDHAAIHGAGQIGLLAALATGTTRLSDLLDSDDTRAMKAALRALGVGIREADNGRTLEIDGIGSHGFQVPAGALDLGTAGLNKLDDPFA